MHKNISKCSLERRNEHKKRKMHNKGSRFGYRVKIWDLLCRRSYNADGSLRLDTGCDDNIWCQCYSRRSQRFVQAVTRPPHKESSGENCCSPGSYMESKNSEPAYFLAAAPRYGVACRYEDCVPSSITNVSRPPTGHQAAI